MHKLYFSDRVVYIDSDASPYDPAEVIFAASIEKANLLQKIQTTKRLALIAPDADALYDQLTSQFPSIEAGGGLVTNPRGEILMIFRHTRWDLPKGKLEPGERIEACAVREVEEETGIQNPQRGEKLLTTNHFYRLNGAWTMKKTTWYAMTHPGDAPLVPQTEEDITALAWVNPAKLDGYLRTTYPTIIDVFAAAGYRI